jgi:hypothetical protein
VSSTRRRTNVNLWLLYAKWVGGGTAVLLFAIVSIGVVGADGTAYALFFWVYYWTLLCALLGAAFLAISATRFARRHFAKPS